jgi:hypothetical protein
MAKVRVLWHAIVNAVINYQVSGLAKQLSVLQEGLCFMELMVNVVCCFICSVLVG